MSKDVTQKERVATLEAQMKQVLETQEKILEKQNSVLLELARYKGAFGAVTLVGSAVAAALMIFKDAILAKFGVGG